MSYDVKMFVLCNHVVNGEYHKDGCPRCYGAGFYLDIFFDQSGNTIIADNTAKLTQELLKIIVENKGDNPFHPDWGCDVQSRVGGKKNPADKFKIELSVKNALEYLQKLQQSHQQVNRNMRPEELIAEIVSVQVVDDGPTGYIVQISVLSQAGQQIAQSVKIK
jgi:phage baseplate assembly protein W